MTKLDSILKSRDVTLPTKVHLVKAVVFPVVMYGCESWTVKKAECRRIDGFELWCWRRLLKAPWTARRSNQSILMEISPGCSLEGLMLKLKPQYFGHLMWRTDSLEKTLRDWGQEEKGTTKDEMAEWHHWLDGHEFEWTPRVGDGQGGLACCDSWGCKQSDTTEWLNWTELMVSGVFYCGFFVFNFLQDLLLQLTLKTVCFLSAVLTSLVYSVAHKWHNKRVLLVFLYYRWKVWALEILAQDYTLSNCRWEIQTREADLRSQAWVTNLPH